MVLTTSTEIDEEDGSRKPRKVVWIIHAGTLIECALEHLRCSSERARQLGSMDKLKDCLGLTKDWMDGWVKDNTRTCRLMLHQTKKIQRTKRKDWQMTRLRPGSMRHDK